VCRAATISGGVEMYGRRVMDMLTGTSDSHHHYQQQQQLQKASSADSVAASNNRLSASVVSSVFRLQQMHVLQTIATDVPVCQSVSWSVL